MILCISVVSVVLFIMSPFFVYNFVDLSLLSFFLNLSKGLSVLFNLFKEPTLSLVNLFYFFLYFIFSIQIFISFLLLTSGSVFVRLVPYIVDLGSSFEIFLAAFFFSSPSLIPAPAEIHL